VALAPFVKQQNNLKYIMSMDEPGTQVQLVLLLEDVATLANTKTAFHSNVCVDPATPHWARQAQKVLSKHYNFKQRYRSNKTSTQQQ
jgi:hypothetical protein